MSARYLMFVTQPYSFGILRPLQDAVRARGGEAAWFVHGVPAGLHAGETHLATVPEVRRFAPRAVFVPGNWVPAFFPGLKVEVFHGLGIDKRGHFRVRGMFDLYCTPGPSVTGPFAAQAARHRHFAVRETGWPKLDPLFRAAPGGGRRPGPPRVLYAPTFSPSLTSAPALLDTVRRLVAARDWHWTVKFHPKEDPAVIAAYAALEGPRLTVGRDPDILPLLHANDVMLTDTSSVSTEFLLLDKPVVTFRNANPGPHLADVRDAADVEGALARALERPADLLAAARAYGAELHPARDGRASERVLDAVDALAAGAAATLAPKPLNLWRRLQARRRLGWYLP